MFESVSGSVYANIRYHVPNCTDAMHCVSSNNCVSSIVKTHGRASLREYPTPRYRLYRRNILRLYGDQLC